MESNFEQMIAMLQTSSTYRDGLEELTRILEKQNSELAAAFIIEWYQSILILEHWAWERLSQDSHEYLHQSIDLHLFRTLALFNKNLIFGYDSIDSNVKAALLIPETTDWINNIFEHLGNTNDDNDPFFCIVSLWFDNISLFLYDNPEFEALTTISYINCHIARNYVMTDQYKFYLSELRQSFLSQSIFTTKQLFYIKTCSLSLGAYLFAKAQDFVYTAEEMMRHLGLDYIQLMILHTYTIHSWSTQVLTCITHLIAFFFSCCCWGGVIESPVRICIFNELTACDYIDALIRIIGYKPFHQCIAAKRSNDQTILLDTVLFSLLNIAQNQGIVWFLRSKISLPDILSSIAETSVFDKMCLCVYAILGEILSDECLKELKISDSASVYFFSILDHAWHHPLKKYKQVPIFHLLKFFNSLSKIDAIQQKTADTNRVSLLIEMCDQYPMVFEIIWALSFNHDIQQQIRSNTSFISKLTHPPKEYNNEHMQKITHGILWNLESNHKDRTTLEINNGNTFEIMISYSHKDEIICRKIYDELIKSGYRVWIDFDQMHGNVMDAMAQAIERSNTILICMSEQYRRSNYCRAEAHYAFQRQLRIVPVLLQEHYKPDGWLLFLVGQLLYIDFTKYAFVQAVQMLFRELKAPLIKGIDVPHVCSRDEEILEKPITYISSILPKNMLEWNSTQVQDWLINHDLLQTARLFVNFDGQSLIHMNELIENLQPQQLVSLLQEDSLRRTNQSLSLTELSLFRSLMNQYKQPSITTTKTNLNKLKTKSHTCCLIM